jgi:hypothetical protein
MRLGEAVAAAVADRRARLADEAVAALSAHAEDVHVDPPRDELDVLRASFLVDRRRHGTFEQALEQLARHHHRVATMELIGPMPPHSFVALDGAAGE